MIAYPEIDPWLVNIGLLKIRWYGFMYLLAIIFGYQLAVLQLKQQKLTVGLNDRVRCCLYLGAGLFAGARLGQALFYTPLYFLKNPLSLPAVWQGGMSSHGAFLGITAAVFLFVRRKDFYKKTGIGFLRAMDILVPALPLGVGLIRIGNFINGSLYGRVSDAPWAMVFPAGGPSPRHPSQIYQFLLEGMILFLILWLSKNKIKIKGGVFCLFLTCHGLFRFLLEFFKEPEIQPAFIHGLTRGQILSLVSLFAGMAIYFVVKKKNSDAL